MLNKTDKITITTATNRWIDYTYDGSGSVIRKRVYDNNVLQTTTDYIGGFVYINSTLAYLPMPEGRVVNNAGTLSPEYILTDLQGNARISFNNTGTGGTAKVVQENSYTGFGLILANSAVTGGTNKNLYNGGSEWQNDYTTVLPDYYETFYRNYDAAIGRFVAVDPDPESAESMTPYQYAENNPVMMNDPGGNMADHRPGTAAYHYNYSDGALGGQSGDGGAQVGFGQSTLTGSHQDQYHNNDGFMAWAGTGNPVPPEFASNSLLLYQAQHGDAASAVAYAERNGKVYRPGSDAFNDIVKLIQIILGNPTAYTDGIRYATHDTREQDNPDYNPSKPESESNSKTETVFVGQKFISWSSLGDLFQDFISQTAADSQDDIAGLTFHANFVDGTGFGVTISALDILDGDGKGFYVTATPSARLGGEDGLSYGFFWGDYSGNGSPNIEEFLGNSLDIPSSEMPGAYYWESFQGINFMNPSWKGVGRTYGPDGGISIGLGVTILLYEHH